MNRARREQIYQAQRIGLRNHVRDDLHVSEELADAILEEWTLQATVRGLERSDPRYWDECFRWVEERFPQDRTRLS